VPDEPVLPVSLTESLVTDPARTVEADAIFRETPPARRPGLPGLLSGINWTAPEILCVGATLLFMLLGGFGSYLGLPAALAPGFFLAAYLAGGWRGSIKGIRSLLGGTVDVDLLMILAALGAACVNHAFEGAMLLFLFSLSGALEHYALGRTQREIRSLFREAPKVATVLNVQGNESELRVELLRPAMRLRIDHALTPGRHVIPSSRNTSSRVARKAANSPRHRTISMQHTRASNASSLPIAFATTPRDSPAYAASIFFFASKYSRLATGLLFFTAPVSSRVYISTSSGFGSLPEKEADSNGQTRNPASRSLNKYGIPRSEAVPTAPAPPI